jgi:predicted small lipoprotein YifL
MQRFTFCAAVLVALAACGSDEPLHPSPAAPAAGASTSGSPAGDSATSKPGAGGIMIGSGT